MSRFAAYVRVSEVGDREGASFGSPEEQEAVAREWADRSGEEIVEVVTELDVSGARAADDRELGRLIRQVEAGDLDGIVVRYLDRFARDLIEGALALRRIVDADGRLVATASGFDSEHLTPDTKMVFDIQMAIAEAQRGRNRDARIAGSRRAADRGVYLSPNPPLGYRWVDGSRPEKANGRLGSGRIEPDPAKKKLLKELFKRRAERESLQGLAEWLRGEGIEITKSGVRVLLDNRAYLGEATMPTSRKGEVEVIYKAHDPIITPEEWERAQAAGGTYIPRNGRWASQARLSGLVYCSGCERRLSSVGGGKKKDVAYYSCTAEGCQARVGIRMERLDDFVRKLLATAFLRREPEIVAIMEGDDRYARALEAVEEARAELEAYVAEVRVTDVGRDAWIRGKEARQGALDLARRALRETPPPAPQRRGGRGKPVTLEEAMPGLMREHNARFISRVLVKPVGRGRRVPVSERVDVWLIGSEEPYPYVEATPDGEVIAA